jgi:hypothetical protein
VTVRADQHGASREPGGQVPHTVRTVDHREVVTGVPVPPGGGAVHTRHHPADGVPADLHPVDVGEPAVGIPPVRLGPPQTGGVDGPVEAVLGRGGGHPGQVRAEDQGVAVPPGVDPCAAPQFEQPAVLVAGVGQAQVRARHRELVADHVVTSTLASIRPVA